MEVIEVSIRAEALAVEDSKVCLTDYVHVAHTRPDS